MTEIDFYLLPANSTRLAFALRLCNKVHKIGHKVFIYTEDETQSEAVSTGLWNFSNSGFLANEIISAQNTTMPVQSPIRIAHDICEQSAPLHDNDVLINLSLKIPPHFSRFQRHVEIIEENEAIKQKLRQHYSFYKQRGYPLNTHKIEKL